MARTKKRICDVTGMETSVNNFYKNQSHKKYPFNQISLDKWGFDLIKPLEIIN